MKIKASISAAIMCSLLLAACGSNADDSSAKKGEDGTLTIPLVFDKTGPAGPYASQGLKGAELAIEVANKNDALDGTTIKPEITDSGSDPQQAVSAVTKAVRANAPVVLYGTSSSMALAMAPVAQKAKMPMLAVQSGDPELLQIGEYIYRPTAPQPVYHELQAQYLEDQGVKKVAVLYNTDNATYNTMGSKLYAKLGKAHGFKVVSEGIKSTDADVSTVVSRLKNSNPDAFVMLLQAQNDTVATQLRRSGFKGIIAGALSIGLPTLESMGKTANGIIWPDIFAPDMDCPSGKAFIEAYRKKYGEVPDALAASGYDGALMLIDGLRNAPSYDRKGVQKGLQKVLETGVADAATCEITFENRDARSPIRLQQWSNGGVKTIETSD